MDVSKLERKNFGSTTTAHSFIFEFPNTKIPAEKTTGKFNTIL
jgi:hypothetical protein